MLKEFIFLFKTSFTANKGQRKLAAENNHGGRVVFKPLVHSLLLLDFHFKDTEHIPVCLVVASEWEGEVRRANRSTVTLEHSEHLMNTVVIFFPLPSRIWDEHSESHTAGLSVSP